MVKNSGETYWAEYYKSGEAPEESSAFAEYVSERYLDDGMTIIELGCGNGRDSYYFASRGVGVVAVDQVVSEIEELTAKHADVSNLKFEVGDFTHLPDAESKFDAVYSRFTLHSVSKTGQDRVLKWSDASLTDGGYLCIETRGQKNELYKKGLPVEGEEDAYIYNNHYRRFVDFDTFREEVSSAGFLILEAYEQKGFAPYDDTDYQFIRVIAQKQ